jgi:Protein of unknown function (DUF2892)
MPLHHALYVKNVPTWERALRIAVAAAVIVYAMLALSGVWRPVVAAGAAGFALTGLLGFCPACAMVGRRLGPVR